MKAQVLGYSVKNQPILGFSWSGMAERTRVVILGGTHGNEIEGVIAAEALLAKLLIQNPFSISILLIPNINPDGVYAQTRSNANGVDLNRNLPSKDWSPVALDPKYPPGPTAGSEPESKVLMEVIQSFKPKMIITLHSFSNYMLNTNGDCVDLAKAMQKVNEYKISPTIGYPTPGSLGTYSVEQSIPCLTYEIERGLAFDKISDIHLRSLWAGLEYLNS